MRHQNIPWPPPFSVRVSARAKYARLRVLPDSGLEVVLPRGIARETAKDIVEAHRTWVCATLRRVCGGVGPQASGGDTAPPATVALHGGVRTMSVLYGSDASVIDVDAICLRAMHSEPLIAIRELQTWMRRYAYETLGNELAALAREHGTPFSALRFRRQKSRWGSCTARGTLSLNTCLVFLPADLARHVMLHELAHTRHLDHGRGFWKTLFAMEPDALAQDKRLRAAWRFVPPWMWL